MINRSQFFWSFLFIFALSSSLSIASELVSIDSVGVQRIGDQSYILHEVDPKETLFGISRRYNSPVSDIVNANPVLKQGLKIGQTIKVPFISMAEIPAGSVLHNVVAGETLFSISQKYGVPVESLMKENGLKGNDLSVGQSLIIEPAVPIAVEKEAVVAIATTAEIIKPETKTKEKPAKKTEEAPKVKEKTDEYFKKEIGPIQESTVPVIGTPKVVSSVDEMMVEPADANTSGGFKNIKETGQAELIQGTGGHKKYLVLHRTAPVGTIMRVKNEENDVTIFARVVGTLPETGDNGKLVIKLSQAAFDQLKAVNGRFPVEVMY